MKFKGVYAHFGMVLQKVGFKEGAIMARASGLGGCVPRDCATPIPANAACLYGGAPMGMERQKVVGGG